MDLLTQSKLSPDEIRILTEINSRIDKNRAYNHGRREYYEAHQRVKNLAIGVPPALAAVKVAIGWPGMVVDALDERLDVRGLVLPGHSDEDPMGLRGIFQDNELDITWQEGHIEALIQGCAFETTSLGDTSAGEPEALITVESPTSMSGIWNPRRRLLDAAGAVIRDEDDQIIGVTLFLPDQTVKVDKDPATRKWIVTDRQVHNIGRPMVRRLVNRSWTSRQWGRSEITKPIIAATDMAMRTLLGAEIAREFYGAPQRVILGAEEKTFKDSSGRPTDAWRAYMGRYLALPRDEMTDQTPTVQQLQGASPTPFIDLIKMAAQLVAGEAALPPTWLGFVTENPASADQIRATEARHVKRAERRQRTFGSAHRGALIDAVMLRDGLTEMPDELRDLAIDWVDAATPTKAASADAAVKLTQANILPASSEVTLASIGLDPTQIAQIKADQRLDQARQALYSRIGQQAETAKAEDPQVREFADRRT